MIIVKFNSVEEFCDEIAKGTPEDRIVRLTNLYTASKLSPNIRFVSVVATCIMKNKIVRLDRHCGDSWGLGNESDQKTFERADKASKAVEATCKRLDYEVRAGIFEEIEK